MLLVLAMLLSMFTLASCGESALEGDDPVAALKYVEEQMSTIKGCTMKISTTTMGMTVSMDAKVDIENNKMHMETNTMGIAIKATVIDGVMYSYTDLSSMGMGVQKMKTTDPDEIKDMMGSTDTVTDSYDYASAEFVSRENGVYVIKGVLTEEAAKEIADESSATDLNATLIYTCNDKGIATKMEIDMSFKAEGETVNMKMVVEILDTNVPEITAPADADSYVEAPTE